jgi:hypothetical protein
MVGPLAHGMAVQCAVFWNDRPDEKRFSFCRKPEPLERAF